MLDSRVRTALTDYQRGRLSLEECAQMLLAVRRETGCLELRTAPSAGEADRALLARFAELVAADNDVGPTGSAPSR